MAKVSKLVARTWALQEGYEFTPDTDFEETSEVSWSQRFRIGGTVRVSGVAWYRGSTGTPGPSRLSIWQPDAGVRLWETFDPPDDGTVGWQQLDLTDTPIDVLNVLSRVEVSAYGGSGTHRTYGSQSTALKGVVPVNVELQAGFRNLSIGDQEPTSVHTGTIQGLDLRAENIPFVQGPQVATNVEAELARWLREDGDHYDESAVKSILGQAAGANETVQSTEYGNATIHQDTQDILTRWSDTLATKLNNTADAINDNLAVYTTALATSITDGMARLAELWNDVLACFGSTPGALLCIWDAYLRFLRFKPQLAEGPDWELVDETDFVNSIIWPVEADVYRVNLTAFNPKSTSQPVGSDTRHAYLATWATYNGEFASGWHYFSTANADLETGNRMPGLGLLLTNGGTGHIQAWRRTEAS